MMEPRTLVIASRNPGKTRELSQLLAGLPCQVTDLSAYPACPEVVEDGATFEANALLKAVAVARFTGQWALADDSGLEVDALGGEPGIHSARWRGAQTDPERVALLLDALSHISAPQRTARFVCVATLANPQGPIPGALFRGVCEGQIALQPHGTQGFGYDPVFIPHGMPQTFAELTPAQKHARSHRGQALALFREWLVRNGLGHPPA